jgi:hypothetical protein
MKDTREADADGLPRQGAGHSRSEYSIEQLMQAAIQGGKGVRRTICHREERRRETGKPVTRAF